MATTTSTASTGSLPNGAGGQYIAGEGGACLPTQTWMPKRGPARTVEAPLPCASADSGFSERGSRHRFGR
eukprot:scaffold7309_cov55-Phaeocystis_antarctica.AAC.2